MNLIFYALIRQDEFQSLVQGLIFCIFGKTAN